MILKKTNDVIIIKRIIEYLIKNKCTNINAFDAYEQFGKHEYNNFKNFQACFKNYFSDEFVFELDNSIIFIYEKIPYFLFNLYYYKKYTSEQLYDELLTYITENINKKYFDVNDSIKLYAIIDSINNLNINYEDEYYVSKFLCNCLFISKKINILKKWLIDLENDIKEKNINFILGNNYIYELLTLYDISKISHIIDSPAIFINLIASFDIFTLCDQNFIYSKYLTDILYEKYDSIFNKLSVRSELCLKYFYGFETGKKETLESVGILLGNITREGVRQLILKGSERVKKILIYEKKYLEIILKHLDIDSKKYILFEDLIRLLKDEYIFKVVLMILDIIFENIKIDYKNHLIYEKEYELDIILDDFIKNYDDAIKEEIYNQYSKNIQLLLNYKYKKFNKVYLKKELRLHNIIDKILIEKLDGVFTEDASAITLINDSLTLEYGLTENYQLRNIKELLKRSDYILIDKSTFKKRTKCLKLSTELERNIFKFIISQTSNIYYEDIYRKFKNDLIEIGINNRYYLKSLIDEFLPDEYKTTKDYITNTENSLAIEMVIAKLKSYNCSFSLDDVINTLSTISPKIIKRLIENERLNSLLKLNNGDFVYKEVICDDEKVIRTIEETINVLISKNIGNVISARQIYAKLSSDKLIEKLNFIHNSFDLFTYLKVEFSNTYYFSRPFIAITKDEHLTIRLVVEKYINNFEIVSFNQIDEFLNRKFISFQKKIDIVDVVSENYVMVSKNELVKKDVLNISSFNITKISNMLDLILKKEGMINSIKFNKFVLMPNIGYKWSKYLLYGIIISYFEDRYQIEFLDTKFNVLEYEIRSIENEI